MKLTKPKAVELINEAIDCEFFEEYVAKCSEEEQDVYKRQVVGPSEVLLAIGRLPLKEKLALWSTKEESLDYYCKKDIRDYILVLDKLKPYRLPETVQWNLMKLPFDVNNDELLNQFILFVEECFRAKCQTLTKPTLKCRTLAGYEEYYQKINLYYSFSKSTNLEFDEQWVYDIRKTVSESINVLL